LLSRESPLTPLGLWSLDLSEELDEFLLEKPPGFERSEERPPELRFDESELESFEFESFLEEERLSSDLPNFLKFAIIF